MICQGPGCGKTFEAKRKNAVYCSPRCRQRGYRGKLDATPAPARTAGKPAGRPARRRRGEVQKYTRAELAAAGKVDTAAGQAALLLARRMDAGDVETGAALAAMVREHANAMERALKDGPDTDPVKARADEVAARRDWHAGAG
jgi:hypothetical protein